MRRTFIGLTAAASLAFGLLPVGVAHADSDGPVTWKSMAGGHEYWNLQGSSRSNGAALIDFPWTGGDNEWFYDVPMTDGYRVEQTKYSYSGTGMCIADPGGHVNAGIVQWACGNFEGDSSLQWEEHSSVYGVFELINQSHDQLATWKYDKYQLFMENRDTSAACDTNSGLLIICAQAWE